jgi:PAS domain-containing protein
MTDAWSANTLQPGVLTDAEGHVLALNAAFGRLFALPDSSLPSGPIEDLIIASRFRAAYRAARRLALTDTPAAADGPPSTIAAIDAEGGEFLVNLSFSRSNDEPPRLATWIREQTEHRTGVSPMQRRATPYERAEELAGFGTWEWTPARILWSDNLFRLYGLRPGEITPSAEHVFAHCHPDDKERLKHAQKELGRTGQRRDLHYRYVWPDGTVRFLTSTVVSVGEAGERWQRLIGTVQDVTDQHQAERQLAARFAVSDALSDWEPGATRRAASGQGSGGSAGVRGRDDVDSARRRSDRLGDLANAATALTST